MLKDKGDQLYIIHTAQKRKVSELIGNDTSIDETKMIKKLLPRIFIKKILSVKAAFSQ